MEIKITSYKLVEAEKLIIAECVKNYPDLTMKRLGDILGIGGDTLKKKLALYNIPYRVKTGNNRDLTTEAAKAILENAGFIVTKKSE